MPHGRDDDGVSDVFIDLDLHRLYNKIVLCSANRTDTHTRLHTHIHTELYEKKKLSDARRHTPRRRGRTQEVLTMSHRAAVRAQG